MYTEKAFVSNHSYPTAYRLFLIGFSIVSLVFPFILPGGERIRQVGFYLNIATGSLCIISVILMYFAVFKNLRSPIYYFSSFFVLTGSASATGLHHYSIPYFIVFFLSLVLLNFFIRGLRDQLFFALLCIFSIFTSAIFNAHTSLNFSAENRIIMVSGFVIYLLLNLLIFKIKLLSNTNPVSVSEETILHLENELLNKEEQLIKARKNLYALISSIDNVVFEFDEQKICLNVWCSKEWIMLQPAGNFLGKPASECMTPWMGNIFNEATDKVLNTGKSASVDFPSPQKDVNKWFNAKFALLKTLHEDKAKHFSVTINDVTEKRAISKASHENKMQLLEAQTTAKMGNWWTDLKTGESYWSNNLYVILEVDAIPKDRSLLGYYLGLVHPDDIDAAKAFLSDLAYYPEKNIIHKIITPKGNRKYMNVKCGYPLKNDDGTIRKLTGIIVDVTEAQDVEKRLKRSQAELIGAQRIAKMGSWKWMVKNNTTTFSDEVINILELSRNQIEENGLLASIKNLLHPDDKSVVNGFIGKAIFEADSSIDYRIRTVTGKTKYINTIIGETVMDDAGNVKFVMGTLQDVTDRKQAESNFHRTEKHYKYVLETINLAAITLNKKGQITFINQFLAQLLGYTRKELIGLNWPDNFLLKTDIEIFKQWFSTAKINREYENTIILKDGGQRILNWKNTINRDDFGNFLGTTSIAEDVTEKRKSSESLLKAKEAAEKSSRFKSEFLSIMSHEIRTPMNAVIGATNLLMMDQPREDQLENLNTLKFSGDNLLALINDILDYNKIEAGKLDIVHSHFNLFELVNNIKQTFVARMNEKGVRFDVNIAKNVPQNVVGDPLRIGQILNNLLGNAIKFTSEGSVTVHINAENLSNSKASVDIKISDTGIGISPEYLKHIFEPFTQASQEIQTNFGGTGLGLAITKRLVELHNGIIHVKSELGKGSIFTFSIPFTLPRTSQHVHSTVAVHSVQDIKPVRSLKGMRILIVDDNQLNIIIGAKFLTNWEAHVDKALNGALAIEKVRQNDYHLIIMDLQMPVMDGFEATKIIKGIKPHIPILALTADAMPETSNKALEAGMTDYLTKPFVPSVLFAKISAHYIPQPV